MMTRTTAEIIEDFGKVVGMTAEEATDLYSFGESDFDPAAALDNAASKLAAEYMELTGLGRDEAIAELHELSWTPGR
jgi:hypothetical protein